MEMLLFGSMLKAFKTSRALSDKEVLEHVEPAWNTVPKERYGWSSIGVGFGVRKVNLLILSDIITHKGKQDQH